jgi:asparagine synthase (glutamine-hydrolysing)
MRSEDGQVAIIFNGEIYNFLELRAELEQRGHAFRTRTDTEVLVKLWQERGEGVLEALNGMFAFAVWERRTKTLFLARDRLGIKPLYYVMDGEGIAFASEVKALLAIAPAKPGVDIDMLDAYMSVGYVPTARTFFAGIQKLEPGCCMTIAPPRPAGEAAGEVRLRRYWQFRPDPQEMGEAECRRRVLDLLTDAVRLQLRSDVPLGVFLSGGVDSATVVALMHGLGIGDIETFNVAYDFGPQFDESRWARKVAERFRTRHHEIYVRPEEFRDFLPELVRHLEEPVTEAAAASLFFVSRLARERVTVVLSGEGSDEVFGGYPIYKYMQVLEEYRRLPAGLRHRLLNPALARMGPFLGGGRAAKWGKYTALSEQPLAERYTGVSFYETAQKDELYRPGLKASFNGSAMPGLLGRYYAGTEDLDPLSRMSALDVQSWLPDDLLVKADKMTMACSLELRVPFLDHRLVELGALIPPRLKIRGWTTKYILKRAMEPYLPKEILYRPKMGFPTPLARMFQGPLHDSVAATLTGDRCLGRGYFRPEVVRRLVAEHTAGAADHHRVLFQLLVLEEWHRAFID